jgi:hypothetical protein
MNKLAMRCLRAVLLLSLFCSTLSKSEAQTSNKSLINSDVVKMVRAGLSTETILIVIQHENSTFDISPAALIILNRNKVSQRIIDAMLATRSLPAPLPVNEPPTQNMGDDFAKASLRALKAIDSESGAASLFNAPGETQRTKDVLRSMAAKDLPVSRETTMLIDDADANARTDHERTVVVLLRNLYLLKLAINRNWREAATYGKPESADRIYSVEPTKTMLASRVLCSRSLESVIRNRLYTGSLPDCSDLSDHGGAYP